MKLAQSFFLFLCFFTSLALAAPEVGEPAPPLRGKFFSGQEFDLQALKGKVVLVNFYSSYCKHCAFEIGILETFLEEHKKDGFEVIVVGVDRPQDRHRVERMLGIYNLAGTTADELLESGFERTYPTPTAFLIDRNGVLRDKTRGGKTPHYYAEKVLPLLAAP